MGWSYEEYSQTTVTQRAFIRKELETVTVDDSTLFQQAVQLAVSNVLAKKGRGKKRLWKKHATDIEQPISDNEMKALQEKLKEDTPWTPWNGKGVKRG